MSKIKINVNSVKSENEKASNATLSPIGGPINKKTTNTFKLPPKKPFENPTDRNKLILKKLGFGNIQQIGKGAYGRVYRATWDSKDGTERAIKVVEGARAQEEGENYKVISKARLKSKDIEKHFPEVDMVKTIDGTVVIVMELLEADPNATGVIKDIFGGREVAGNRADLSLQDLDINKNLGKRALAMISDEESKAKLLKDILSRVGKKIDTTAVFNKMSRVNFQNMMKVNKPLRNKVLTIWEEPYGIQAQFQKHIDFFYVLEEDMDDTPQVINFMLYLISESWKSFFKKNKKEDDYEDMDQLKKDFVDDFKWGIEALSILIRQWSPFGISPGSKNPMLRGAPQDIQGAGYPGTKSIVRALADLKRITGLQPRDIHDQNAMVRHGTKEIVIVDVGLFAKNLYEIRLRIKNKS